MMFFGPRQEDPDPEQELGDVEDKFVCHCGSEKDQYSLYDARGIFVAYVCDDCVEDVKSKYRPEIFTDPNYETDEPIDD